MENVKITGEFLDDCPLMGRSFMLTHKVESIGIPEGYLCPEQGITLESVCDFGGKKHEFGRPKMHKKYSGFYCYRASLQGPVLYYFCVQFTKRLGQPASQKIFIFRDSDLVRRCVYDTEPLDTESLEVTAHHLGPLH